MKSFIHVFFIAIVLCLSVHNLKAQSEALKILPNGNVGIGTPDPKTALEVNGTVTATAFQGNGAMVRGMIVMWSGRNDSIPVGWALCDGKQSTPDLRNRFIVGAGSTYNSRDTGGQNQVTLNETQLPAHVHTGTTSTNGDHSHNIESGPGNNLQEKRKRTFSGKTSAWSGYTDDGVDWRGLVPTDVKGNHSHTFTTAPTGGNAAHENRPPYYALAYIMKL